MCGECNTLGRQYVKTSLQVWCTLLFQGQWDNTKTVK